MREQTIPCQCGITTAEWRGLTTVLSLLAVLLLAWFKMQLVFTVAKVLC